jgi:hypothetical protein
VLLGGFDFLCMFFVCPLLNKLIKKAVCIFLIWRLGVILPFIKDLTFLRACAHASCFQLELVNFLKLSPSFTYFKLHAYVKKSIHTTRGCGGCMYVYILLIVKFVIYMQNR